jgi:hypothetical protein
VCQWGRMGDARGQVEEGLCFWGGIQGTYLASRVTTALQGPHCSVRLTAPVRGTLVPAWLPLAGAAGTKPIQGLH